MTTLTIDDREKPCGIVDALKNYPDINIIVKRLSLGDYLIDEKILVERKTLTDFAQSIVDGRLFKQVKLLTNSEYQYALILEGDQTNAEKLGVSREAMQGALISVSLIYGVSILRARNLEETARLLNYIANQLESIKQGSLQRKGGTPKTKYKLQLHILQGLPYIGVQRAKQLLQHFGTVEKAITAPKEELQNVIGIGKHIAEKIRWAMQSVCENK